MTPRSGLSSSTIGACAVALGLVASLIVGPIQAASAQPDERTRINIDGSLPPADECASWPDADSFGRTFVSDSGRVIDPATPNGQTTSEGQSYGLFFALVANDRTRFHALLRWTQDNLANGDLTTRLPAWQWGKHNDGTWGIVDDHSASDADLWIAYVLIEAGKLWKEPRYTALGQLLAVRILREETIVVDGLGRVLLPGTKGFQPSPDSVRLNPSYVPIQLLQRLAATAPDAESAAQWRQQIKPAVRLFTESGPLGFVPDWVIYRSRRGFSGDEATAAAGSFNAIRSYLWAGMLPKEEPLRTTLTKSMAPMIAATIANGLPPLRVDTRSGLIEGSGDAGFSAAMLPLLSTVSASATNLQRTRIIARSPFARQDNYYEQALTLFGLGWLDGRYRFAADGSLKVRWPCSGR